jgi:hypothetical protein
MALISIFSSLDLNEQQKTLPVQYAWKGVLCKSEAQNNLPGQGDFLLLFFAKIISEVIGNKVSALRGSRQRQIWAECTSSSHRGRGSVYQVSNRIVIQPSTNH